MKVQPVVLIATTARWFATARLAAALANAKCTVEVLSPPGHPVLETRAVRRVHTYYGFAPLTSFAAAISTIRPDLIIPGDDLAVQYLQDVYHRELNHGTTGRMICASIERSLCPLANLPLIYSRTAFMELAVGLGIRVPKTEKIAEANELRNWLAQTGLPTVLKADGTSSGEGIRIIRSIEDAERAFRKLQAPPPFLRALRRALLNRDMRLVYPSIRRRRYVLSAQAFIQGRDATSTVACWKGKVLAGLHFEVLNKRDPTGPSTVLRLIENDEISSAIEKVVHRLNLSGVHGFDFVLESGTNHAYLVEMNSRATQTVHLTLGPGRDLPAAIYAVVSGTKIQEAPKLTENNTIALFPQEWIRNPTSAYLQTAYHDIPWEEPELVRACVRKRWNRMAWYSERKWMEAFSAVRLPRL